jgi:catechol 2,3-dioxygenase-like lactoylglutathione lyase family enzyme
VVTGPARVSVPVATVARMTAPDTTPPDAAAPEPVGRLAAVALDCPDPATLAAFYARVLGAEVDDEESDDDWVQLGASGGAVAVGGGVLAFQRVDDYRPPQWPGAEQPQQLHLDIAVADLDAGEAAVVALGARKHEVQPGESFRVFLDPVGHPFCLVRG